MTVGGAAPPSAPGPDDALSPYRAKRDFEKTPEPSGGEHHGEALSFVVQEHHASRLHWDFRLELDGVLLSWAVPKGPSLDPADKRLAVRTEDHPLDYGGFEGEIPQGEYGGGTVIIWDRGTWEPVADPHAGLEKGDLKFVLHGDRLHGRFVLVRMKPRPKDRGENWLLIKERDEFVREGGVAEVVLSARAPGRANDEPPAPGPGLPPIALCTLVSEPPSGPGWFAEVKYDGYRLRVRLVNGHAQCLSRSDADVTERFSAIAAAVRSLPAESALLDGEAVVFDERGATDFGALNDALANAPDRIEYAAFDLLELNGHDLTAMPTSTRRDLLATLLADLSPAARRIRLVPHVPDDAAAFHETACAQGLEGAVFKRADAAYPRGRTRTWLKVKCRREGDFVVTGSTPPGGSRAGFGALVLAVNDPAGGGLVHAGRVGSGFSESELGDIASRLDTLGRETPPVTPRPEDEGVRWVEPRLVVSVAFAEWTSSGVLRQASFLRVRDDVDPGTVVREDPEPPPAGPVGEAPDAGPAAGSPPGTGTGSVAAPDTGTTAGARVAGVVISNPEKRLFPEAGPTKLELARYYEAVAPLMLREAGGRPLTLVRCPVGDGSGTCFYQRHPDRGLPQRVSVVSHALTGHDESEEWLAVDDVAGLVSLAQMGVAEIHRWMARADAPSRPDRIVFDLDPGPGVEWRGIVDAALALREACEELGFSPHVNSTGSKGLHVVLAIEPVWESGRAKALARTIAERVAARSPATMTTKMAKSERPGRVYLDYLRNAEGASAIAPYSTRFLPGAPVATPLAWDEVDEPGFDLRAFTPHRVLERVGAGIDPWSGLEDSAAGAKVLRAAEGTLDV